MSSTLSTRHLAIVPDGAAARMQLEILRRLAAPRTVPQEVIDHLADLDGQHETAADRYDMATRELDEVRKALTEAAKALTAAEAEWSEAGWQMDQAARACSRAREEAGLVFGSSGYERAKR
jgi:hypothetical protein